LTVASLAADGPLRQRGCDGPALWEVDRGRHRSSRARRLRRDCGDRDTRPDAAPLRQIEAARTHWHDKERCLVCDVVTFESVQSERVIDDEGDFIAWCPYAIRYPFEVQLASRRHSPFFMNLDEAQAGALAQLLSRVMKALDIALRGADMNLCLSLSPSTQSFARGRHGLEQLDQFWHWRIELIPRLLTLGGFELGTDLVINPTAPEAAAAHLRSLIG